MDDHAKWHIWPGVTLQEANADQKRMLAIWLKEWPPAPGFSRAVFESAGFGPKLQPLKQEVVGNIGTVLWVLMGTIGLVLLIACANVASLLLVRANGRRREIAIRAAIGAGRARIMQQLLTESVLLSLTGGFAGLALGLAGIRALLAVNTANLPRLGEKGTLVGADWRVLVFTFSISIGTGILFGLFPALQASDEDALVLIWGEALLRFEAGEAPQPAEFRERFPRHADALALQFELQGHLMEDGHCVRTIHAEANAIIQAVRNGVRIEGATVYVTASPCWGCFKMIANAGCMRIVFGEFYRDERIFRFATQLGIELSPLTPTEPREPAGAQD